MPSPRPLATPFLLLSLATGVSGTGIAQYVGKVAGSTEPVLRATAVYQYTGALLKPNASRLVPVVVWDGERYQPGSLYLARPEPLAVAPGTQYVLEQSGVPQGLFDVRSAAQLNGTWVGLGHAKPEAAPPPLPKLHASRQLPTLTGGAGKGRAGSESSEESRKSGKDTSSPTEAGPSLHRKTDGGDTSDSTGPTLHRRSTGEDSGSTGSDTGSSPPPDGDRPTLHRKDVGTASSAPPADPSPDSDRPTLHRKDSDTASTAPDPDRPTLHRKESDTAASTPDPDRPTLHRHADGSDGPTAAPDPDRPHLRYGAVTDNARAQPTLLSDSPSLTPASSGAAKPGDPLTADGTQPVPLSATVAVSDTRPDEPRSFRFAWPSPAAEAEVRQSMHALALRALAGAVQGSFGPAAAAGDAALKHSATAGLGQLRPGHATGRSVGSQGSPKVPDPLQDGELSAWELSPGGSTTYVYSAHTAPGTGPNPIQRYVTVIAQADFAGKPQLVFSQTTRSDTLTDTPALHLLDAVDTDGDHRAELLFSEQTAAGALVATTRAFAVYSLTGGKAEPVYTTDLRSTE